MSVFSLDFNQYSIFFLFIYTRKSQKTGKSDKFAYEMKKIPDMGYF